METRFGKTHTLGVCGNCALCPHFLNCKTFFAHVAFHTPTVYTVRTTLRRGGQTCTRTKCSRRAACYNSTMQSLFCANVRPHKSLVRILHAAHAALYPSLSSPWSFGALPLAVFVVTASTAVALPGARMSSTNKLMKCAVGRVSMRGPESNGCQRVWM